MKDFKIQKKLAICFGILLAVLTAVGGLAVYKLASVSADTAEIGGPRKEILQAAATINGAMSDYRIAESAHILSSDATLKNKYERDVAEQQQLIETNIRFLDPRIKAPAMRTALDEFRRHWVEYQRHSATTITASRQGKAEEATALLADSRDEFDAANNGAENMQVTESKVIDEVTANAESDYVVSRNILIVAILLAAALVV